MLIILFLKAHICRLKVSWIQDSPPLLLKLSSVVAMVLIIIIIIIIPSCLSLCTVGRDSFAVLERHIGLNKVV